MVETIINLDVVRSDLVCDLRNKALQDCHNPFKYALHRITQTNINRNRQQRIDRKDKQMQHMLKATLQLILTGIFSHTWTANIK